MHFDLAGICVSSGSACSSGKVKVSHVLSAMGYSEDIAASSLRVSLGYQTTEADIDAFLQAWKALYNRTVGRKG
jgi:cysteine desulfurase